jgi:hypothetical protein
MGQLRAQELLVGEVHGAGYDEPPDVGGAAIEPGPKSDVEPLARLAAAEEPDAETAVAPCAAVGAEAVRVIAVLVTQDA